MFQEFGSVQNCVVCCVCCVFKFFWCRTAQNFAFFLSPAGNFIISSLSGSLLVEFWWCFGRSESSNVHVWSSLVVKTLAGNFRRSAPPLGPHLFWVRAPTPPHPKKLAKCGLAKFGQTKLAKFGQIRFAKCGQLTLAKCGVGQIRFSHMRPNKDGQIRFGQMRSRPAPLLSDCKFLLNLLSSNSNVLARVKLVNSSGRGSRGNARLRDSSL